MVVKKASELKPFVLTQNKYILFLFTQHTILTCSEVHLYWKLMGHSQNREVGNYCETNNYLLLSTKEFEDNGTLSPALCFYELNTHTREVNI